MYNFVMDWITGKGRLAMARTSFKLGRSSNPTMTNDDIRRLVEKKAFELYEKRGRKTGHSMDDWLEAERIVKSKLSR
ncbi:MAG: hypothetical protein A2987_01860 [Omnitrophica bacterium RIFCSPLOWO2_01_FULL_45_10]|nr:MAG: hypothetical protein A2987_01860 [Omnitrophica bacterium RIFCSPLOWO2_01_FULL_45_10]